MTSMPVTSGLVVGDIARPQIRESCLKLLLIVSAADFENEVFATVTRWGIPV